MIFSGFSRSKGPRARTPGSVQIQQVQLIQACCLGIRVEGVGDIRVSFLLFMLRSAGSQHAKKRC